MGNNKEGFFWPTQEQELLLNAALLQGEKAITSWKSWGAAVNFDQLDAGSQRLLPLLYKNLTDHNINHPAINVYKGFYRMTWYKNRLLSHRLVSVLRLLDSNGIPVLLLKGAALVPLYYKNWALRPMSDFDLLVPHKDALKTVNLLCNSGWRPTAQMIDESDLVTKHAGTLIDDSGIEFDLHWKIMHESGRYEDDYNFLDGTGNINFENISVSVLSHTDQLFHILIHGTRWNEIAPLRWVPDSMMILREAGDSIDWDRLVNEARRRCLAVPLKKALLYLHETFAAPIPAETILSLKKMKPSLTERMEFLIHSNSRNFLRDIFYLWFTHVRTSNVNGSLSLVLRFPSFLRRFWKVPQENNLAFFLILKLAKRSGMTKTNNLHIQSNL
ncbi:MAG: hypothetical protein APR62_08390 [Smithella sp. SDB]|nr:MAG: hypothetical protein APR62_08390 [Smithella sp. SDB]